MPVVYSPLSDSELDSICLSLVNQELPYFSAFHEAFVLLYLTGCRVEEIFSIHRWERLQGYEMMFLPQKDNYWRYVTLDSRCDNFIDAVVGQYKPFGGLSSGQLNSLFYNFSEYSNFKVGSKPVSLYLFRYNFIRRLFNDGLNINQIADKMGYTSTSVVGGYLTAEIEKGFFLDTDGFININGTWWCSSYFNVDDGGGEIYVSDVFGDGQPIGYYTRAAAGRVLSNFPNYRLPSEADYNNLVSSSFSYPSYGLRCYCLPDILYYSTINSFMINYLDLGFKGTGYYSNAYLSSLRSSSILLCDYYNSTHTSSFSFNVSSSVSYYSLIQLRFYLPFRVILVL